MTKINRINFHSVINELNLGSIIYPRIITSDYILKYVRSTYNSKDSNVETLYKLANGKAEALEFIIKADSAVAGIPLADLHFRKKYSDLLYLPQWQSYYPEWSGYHDGR